MRPLASKSGKAHWEDLRPESPREVPHFPLVLTNSQAAGWRTRKTCCDKWVWTSHVCKCLQYKELEHIIGEHGDSMVFQACSSWFEDVCQDVPSTFFLYLFLEAHCSCYILGALWTEVPHSTAAELYQDDNWATKRSQGKSGSLAPEHLRGQISRAIDAALSQRWPYTYLRYPVIQTLWIEVT